jgi:hypothetical protein
LECHVTPAQLREAYLPFSLSQLTLDGLERIKPDIDLLHLMEVQRRTTFNGGAPRLAAMRNSQPSIGVALVNSACTNGPTTMWAR